MQGDPWTAVIIEDDPDVRDLIDIVLTQSGFSTFVAPDGPTGVEAVRQHNPLITTLDVNMPGMDGFAVARRLREFSNTYLIMITALADEIDVVQGFEAGADDYLVKPFRPRELRARADSMLRRPRSRADQPVGWADDDASATAAAPVAPPPPPKEESWAAAAARDLTQNSPLRVVRDDEPAQPAPPVQPEPVAPPPQPTYQPQVQQPVQPPAQPTYQQPVQQPVQPTKPYRSVPPQAYEPQHQAQAAYEPPPAPPAYPQAPPVHQPAPPQGGAHASPAPAAPAAPGPSADGSWVRFNGLALNHESRVVTVGGGAVDLNRTEFDLLASLLSTGRRVRSKADLVLTMRGQQYVTSYFVNEADKRSVEVHIANLRRKLGDDGATSRFIETVRGVGYRLAETA
ncbi:winged helix-turn-helix transcriptional regulator [Nocardioides deserti]|uniref:Response regulator transcription factor n=1 Tax=Nocardioides deserti TaxID=1588644 RepID=A0ABR6UA10_9ACTN|nr:response regulator transcription factor [Nocardioides deserti]MBC2960968.1 response regulator transcription factor [Nocardioides deserti]GGO75969.1 hypothetical protein GCM10012276_27600 [Nocardioides deserti]